MKHQAYIGIGANLGDALTTVRLAITLLDTLPQTRLHQSSSLFTTAPIDSDGGDYINAVALIATALDAHTLLQHLQELELRFGRERPYRNAPRTLDLDLLLYDVQIIASPSLTVPHPRMTERAFVLLPLLQITPTISIPKLGLARGYLASVQNQGIKKIDAMTR